MKNIKKLLALALVLVLALGMVPFVAASGPADMNVTDYSDYDAIEYEEAVDVLTALGVLQGDQGIFRPSDSITRAEAAKIIAYINLGTGTADALLPVSTGFDDVPASHWASPFIAYCVSSPKGIIAGYGDGNFGPEDNVTAVQLGKMLLMSIGYGVNGEYEGPGWELAVIDRARQLGVEILTRTGESVNYAAAASREEVAQYTFNALTIPPQVSWNSTINDYSSWGDIFGFQGTRNTLGRDTFRLVAEEAYDAYGFEGVYWRQLVIGSEASRRITGFYNYDIIISITTGPEAIRDIPGTNTRGLTTPGSPVFKARLVYPGEVFDGVQLFPLLAGREASDDVVGGFDTGGLQYFINGVRVDYVDIQGTSGPTSIAARRGVIVYLVDTFPYDGHADKVVVVYKNSSVVTIDPIVNANGDVTINGITNPDNAGLPIFPSRGDAERSVIYPADLKAGDIVLYHMNADRVTIVEKADSFEGSISRVNEELVGTLQQRTAVINETTYWRTGTVQDGTAPLPPQAVFRNPDHFNTNSAIRASNMFPDFTADRGNFGIEATIYVDDGNAIVAIIPHETSRPDYMVIFGAQQSSTFGGVLAEVLLSGETRTRNIPIDRLIETVGTGTDDVLTRAPEIEAALTARIGAAGSAGTGFPGAPPSTDWWAKTADQAPIVASYTVNSAGQYTVVLPTAANTQLESSFSTSNRNRAATLPYFAPGNARNFNSTANFLMNSPAPGSMTSIANGRLVADDNTVFVIETRLTNGTRNVFRYYEGVRNAPRMTDGIYYAQVVTSTDRSDNEFVQFVYAIGLPENLGGTTYLFPTGISHGYEIIDNEEYRLFDVIDVESTTPPYTKEVMLNLTAAGQVNNAVTAQNTRLTGLGSNVNRNSILLTVDYSGDVIVNVTPTHENGGWVGIGTNLTQGNNLSIGPISPQAVEVNNNTLVYRITPTASPGVPAWRVTHRGGLGLINLNPNDEAMAVFSRATGEATLVTALYIIDRPRDTPGAGGGGAGLLSAMPDGTYALEVHAASNANPAPTPTAGLASYSYIFNPAADGGGGTLFFGLFNTPITVAGGSALDTLLRQINADGGSADTITIADGNISGISLNSARGITLDSTLMAATATVTSAAIVQVQGSANNLGLAGAGAKTLDNFTATNVTLDNTANVALSIIGNSGTIGRVVTANVAGTTINTSRNVAIDVSAREDDDTGGNTAAVVTATAAVDVTFILAATQTALSVGGDVGERATGSVATASSLADDGFTYSFEISGVEARAGLPGTAGTADDPRYVVSAANGTVITVVRHTNADLS